MHVTVNVVQLAVPVEANNFCDVAKTPQIVHFIP